MMPCIAGHMTFKRDDVQLVVYVSELQKMFDGIHLSGKIVGFDGATNSILVQDSYSEVTGEDQSTGRYVEYLMRLSVSGKPEVRKLDSVACEMIWNKYGPEWLNTIQERYAKFLKKRQVLGVSYEYSLEKSVHYVLYEDTTTAGVAVYRVLRLEEVGGSLRQVPEAYHRTWGVTEAGMK